MFANVREMQLTLTMDDTLSRIHGNCIRNPFLTLKVTFIYTTKTWTLTQGKLTKSISFICDKFHHYSIQGPLFCEGKDT